VTLQYDADAQASQSLLNWHKSSLCPNNATCVEVAALPNGGHAMRDGKNPTSPALVFGAASWSEFLTAARAGKFDGSL
jgi:hypothetical protein